jgi:integrase
LNGSSQQKLTFKQFSEKWGQIKAGGVKASTMDRYANIISRLFIPKFGERPLSEVTTTDLVEFCADRRKEVRTPKTAINEIALLKMMFSEAKKWGYLSVNPAVELERPKNWDHEIEILTPKELSLLVANTDGHYVPAFRTAIMTGVRAGELCALQWPDFQPDTMQLCVRRTVWNGQFQTPKTKNANRAIDLPDELVHELKLWKLRCPPIAPAQQCKHTDHERAEPEVSLEATGPFFVGIYAGRVWALVWRRPEVSAETSSTAFRSIAGSNRSADKTWK